MSRASAGILPYRRTGSGLEVLLVHPGGPFWIHKDLGAWSIAKGEVESGEEPFDTAVREFAEETGCIPAGEFLPLTAVRQRGGKLVHAWAVELDWDPAALRCNSFTMEWPRGSGRMQRFPEVDRAAWFAPREALERILEGQRMLVEELHRKLLGGPVPFDPPRTDHGPG